LPKWEFCGRGAQSRSADIAEALRRTTLALIDRGKPSEAHPAYWAPFIVVGENGALSTG
jgi:CHAT domain-containing protein